MNVDNNFPAPLQVLLLLGAATLFGILALVTTYGVFRRKPWMRKTLGALVLGIVIYAGLLAAFSVLSHEKTLARDEEKYFCEIDCHLAYSVTDVQERTSGDSARELMVQVRTRFDASTISSRRLKDAPLTPNPRQTYIVDSSGNRQAPVAEEGTPFSQPLIPGESYTTTLQFRVPSHASGLRLLITAPSGPVELLIGNELSIGHKKTYLAL